MYLKTLEIQGFKSFPDKTTLHFGCDITAIVGPNGSGKSNISDAIRWVMGEQSTKALRGAKMEDVIFGGTQKRAQVGFAEASLTFDNTDGSFRLDAKEIMVTRRYYRSGESEYYINRQSARLRDINELFMDTGLGKEGYSNISQGRIDEILSVKSTDRREIFEEAAGISKYRHRKEETERRLATTQDNLLRIGDKISELELQVEPLRHQAEKATKYLALRDQLKGLEVAVWLDTLEKLSQTARKAEEDYNSAVFILRQMHDALDQMYVTAESLTLDLHARDLQTEELRQTISEMEGECRRLEGQLAVLQENLRNIRANIERVQQELDDQRTRSQGVETQIQQTTARLTEIDTEDRELQRKLQSAEHDSAELANSAQGLTRQYLLLRDTQTKHQTDLAARQADITACRDSLQALRNRRQQAQKDSADADARHASLKKSCEQTQDALTKAKEQVASCKNTIDGYTLRLQSRKEKRDTLQKEVQQLSVTLETTASRAKMLREMEREYEGYSKAVRFVMQQKERGVLRNIHGPVSGLIKTEDAYTVAIEIALGSAMQQIVVGDEQDAKYAISMLKSRDCGRATFLPLSTIRGRVMEEPGLPGSAGFVGIASELVTCAPEYRQIVDNLLGRTVIAENMDQAIAMARKFHHRFRIVTLDGQVMNAGGSMTGGSVSKSAGILSRANEEKRLTEREKELRAKLVEQKKLLEECIRNVEAAAFAQSTAQGQLRQTEDTVLRLEGEHRQYAALLDALQSAMDTNQREKHTIDAQISTETQREKTLQQQIDQLTISLGQQSDELGQLSQGQSDAEEKANAIAQKITQYKMMQSALRAERTTAQASLENLRALSADMQGDRKQKEALMAEYDRQAQALEQQMQQVREQQTAQTEKTEAQRQKLKNALEERKAVEAKKTKTEREAQQRNKEILDMERESARLENRKATAELEEKQIIDKLWDSYELTRSTAVSARAEIESLAQANRDIAALRRKINALGTPNLGAIDEYARVNERYQYLHGQQEDVLSSRKELEHIIRDITMQMTEIFVVEFAKINEYFSKTFVEMFGGGKAALVLEDPNDPLGCGIEIRVQPPGKQLKTITLLSGGEKAFVAIALYFAILKVRPTPFCMLDEIDAALDDRNVQRFANYLRNLCQKTQFIVITHRRGTMEQADILYGVTMQEQGVSKILHLDMQQMEEHLGIIE